MERLDRYDTLHTLPNAYHELHYPRVVSLTLITNMWHTQDNILTNPYSTCIDGLINLAPAEKLSRKPRIAVCV